MKPTPGMITGGGANILFEWNPATIKIHKKAHWAHLHAAGREQPVLQYGCGEAKVYTFELDLSKYNKGEDYVKQQMEALMKLTVPTSGGGAGIDSPPIVQLILGSAINVTGVVEAVDEVYGPLFDPQSLNPVFGKATIHFTEYK